MFINRGTVITRNIIGYEEMNIELISIGSVRAFLVTVTRVDKTFNSGSPNSYAVYNINDNNRLKDNNEQCIPQ
jgi:hypothetical protein